MDLLIRELGSSEGWAHGEGPRAAAESCSRAAGEESARGCSAAPALCRRRVAAVENRSRNTRPLEHSCKVLIDRPWAMCGEAVLWHVGRMSERRRIAAGGTSSGAVEAPERSDSSILRAHLLSGVRRGGPTWATVPSEPFET